MTTFDPNFTHSTLRERIVEHVFVGDALRALWRRGVFDVEVLRSEFDAFGYDIVMSRGPVVRHIQFKTQGGSSVSISRRLCEKPSGCVVWITLNHQTLDLGPFYFLGGKPGEPMPEISGHERSRRTTRNKQGERPVRASHHDVPRAAFRRLDDIDAVLEELFGKLPKGHGHQAALSSPATISRVSSSNSSGLKKNSSFSVS